MKHGTANLFGYSLVRGLGTVVRYSIPELPLPHAGTMDWSPGVSATTAIECAAEPVGLGKLHFDPPEKRLTAGSGSHSL